MTVLTKKELEKREAQNLASYAVLSSKSQGRQFPETEDLTRTVFQRDRDRIIHSKSFRRLSGKTQVFVATYGDHFHDRLSHTLEVAQVARDLARNLRLNEDLCEVVALAHDLGHTPFGHAGEQALNKIMQDFGLEFEHNEQSRRIVETLEKQFPNFDGLNLSYEVTQGLIKHQTFYDQDGKEIAGKTLEAQVVDIADEIVYLSHDLDDGLRSELFKMEDLNKIIIWRDAEKEVVKKYKTKMDDDILRRRIVSNVMSIMISDVLNKTVENLKKYKIRTLKDVLNQPKNIVEFNAKLKKKLLQLRDFLWNRMYKSAEVKKYSVRGQKIIEKLFWQMYKKPSLLPRRFCDRIKHGEPKEVVVKDYVAGCTDVYAENLLKNN
ncbi:MAG: dNTP triphosphohydrolase [Candidatus Gracilibacteria bacterium]